MPKTCQKPYAKIQQKPHKNLVRYFVQTIYRTKICSNHTKIFYDNFNIKILNNNKKPLILPNKPKTPNYVL